MAAIYLIRHGQASFGKADYDQLSDKGIQQSVLLGKYWQNLSKPSKVFSGDLLRHEQTREHFLSGLQANPSSIVLHSGFNEFNHVDMLSCYDDNWRTFALATPNNTFQKHFSLAMQRWVCGEYDADYKETWTQFKKRCVNAIKDVINQELNKKSVALASDNTKDICIFTSGGTISVIVQHILGLSDQATLSLNQQIRNTAVTKLLFSDQQLNLDYLNNYSHLTQEGDDWVTFR